MKLYAKIRMSQNTGQAQIRKEKLQNTLPPPLSAGPVHLW